MREALLLAEEASAADEIPVGAVVVRNGEIIGRGRNRTGVDRDATAHAELLAIRDACRTIGESRLEGCLLYVTLEPCPMCAGAIVLSRLSGLFYGAWDAKAGAAGTLYTITTDPRLNHRLETHGGVLDEECGELLSRYFRSKRNT